MAIIVEEEKKYGAGIVSVIVTLLILGIVAAAVYYLFFKEPELISVETPDNVRRAEELSKIKIDPAEIVGGSAFQSLNQNAAGVRTPSSTGRTNPFLPF